MSGPLHPGASGSSQKKAGREPLAPSTLRGIKKKKKLSRILVKVVKPRSCRAIIVYYVKKSEKTVLCMRFFQGVGQVVGIGSVSFLTATP